jgi:hypothetical protein
MKFKLIYTILLLFSVSNLYSQNSISIYTGLNTLIRNDIRNYPAAEFIGNRPNVGLDLGINKKYKISSKLFEVKTNIGYQYLNIRTKYISYDSLNQATDLYFYHTTNTLNFFIAPTIRSERWFPNLPYNINISLGYGGVLDFNQFISTLNHLDNEEIGLLSSFFGSLLGQSVLQIDFTKSQNKRRSLYYRYFRNGSRAAGITNHIHSLGVSFRLKK